MQREPGFYFYTGDWLKDPLLRMCSKAAKGCFIDMLAILDGCPFRGVFVTAAGEPWTDLEIAAALGGDATENMAAITELLRNGVVSRNQRGAIFSRRMVRDQNLRERNAARKRKERKNSRLTQTKQTKCVTPSVTHDVTPLSEEEIETEKERIVVNTESKTSFQERRKEPLPEVSLKMRVEAFDSEEFVSKLREIYVPRGQNAPIVEMAAFEAIEFLVKQNSGWHRSDAAAHLLKRTELAAGMMRRNRAPDKWPTLYTFLHDRRFTDEPEVWRETNGKTGQKSRGERAIEELRRLEAGD